VNCLTDVPTLRAMQPATSDRHDSILEKVSFKSLGPSVTIDLTTADDANKLCTS